MLVRGSRKFLKPAPTLYVEDHPYPPAQSLFTLVSLPPGEGWGWVWAPVAPPRPWVAENELSWNPSSATS